jgi:hypothetical protein
VFSSIGFLRIFDQVYNMTSNDPGGPLNSTKPLVLMIYQTAFSSYQMGYAAAQTVVLFVILLASPGAALDPEGPLMSAQPEPVPGSPWQRSPRPHRRLDAAVPRRRGHDHAAALHVLDLAEGRPARSTICAWSRPADARQLRQGAVRRALPALVRELDDHRDGRHPVCLFFDSLVGYTLAKFAFRGRYIRLPGDPVDADDPDRDAGHPLVSDGKQFRLARQLLGHHVPGHDDRLRHLPDEAVLRDRAERFPRGGAVDGLNEFAIWWKVALPLVTPALSALAIFTFLGNWTAFFWPLIVTTERRSTPCRSASRASRSSSRSSGS